MGATPKSCESKYAQDKPTCPYCGHLERDAWDIDFGPSADGEAVITCGACDEEYLCYRDCHITYNCHGVEP